MSDHDARILVVDDVPENVRLLEAVLEAVGRRHHHVEQDESGLADTASSSAPRPSVAETTS